MEDGLPSVLLPVQYTVAPATTAFFPSNGNN